MANSSSPIPSQPTSILDLGCGTSTWAIEIATKYPNTKVYGIDLGQPQPEHLPPNYTYLIGNFEEPWPFQDAQFDYIHGRFINVGMSKHKFVITEALRCLKTGGWFEMQEFVMPQARSTVETLRNYWKYFVEVAENMGRDFHAPISWPTWLREVGFQNVQVEDFEWVFGAREGETDERKKEVSKLALDNYLTGIRGFNMGFYTRGAGWSEERVDSHLDEVRKAMRENLGESVLPLNVVWAQRPE